MPTAPRRSMCVPRPVHPLRVHRLLAGAGLLAASLVLQAGTPDPGAADANQVPNAGLHGSAGAIGTGGNGIATGTVPTSWRTFALEDGVIETEVVPLPADALFPGSPPTNAVRITVDSFGTSEGFDHANLLFPVRPGARYSARVYLRSDNADNSAQGLTVGFPLFDQATAFTGRAPGSLATTVGTGWTLVEGPGFVAEAGDAYGHLSFRLSDDGGDDSVLMALPDVAGLPLSNLAPNPAFAGAGGAIDGDVSGTIPDAWRAFAVGAGSLDVDVVPVAANALFAGSPPTQAVRLEVSNGDGGSEGFDHELVRAALRPGHRYHGEVWMRSGNAGGTPQGVSVAMPVFDAGGFTGTAPGSIGVVVGPDWSPYAGPQFEAVAGEETDLAFRLSNDGDDDIVFIALPRIVGPPPPEVFEDGFEAD